MSVGIESKSKKVFRIFYSIVLGFFWYYSPLNRFHKMKFMSDKEMVKEFLKGKSITRYGDGELRIIGNIPSDFFQKNDNKLAKKMLDVLDDKNENLIVCFPKPLKTLKGLNLRAKLFWISNIFWNRKIWRKYVDLSRTYGNTQITRPYMDYKNKSEARVRYKELKKIWDNKNICIVEGENTHLGEGNDLFNNAKKIKRIIAPAENAFDKFDEILEEALKVQKEYIFLVALGPTATVLVPELSKNGRTAFDIGHIDIEYEWMLGGAKKKIVVEGKAVNENNEKMPLRVLNIVRRIKIKDFFAPFVFLVLLIPSWIFRVLNKIKKRKLWLVAESGEARDNGYYFYRFMRDKHPEDYCFYVIKKDNSEYEKIAKMGNVIKYGGLRHWLYYMSANLNISSEKSGNPCPMFWYFVHVTLGFYRNRVFLQHGVIKDDIKCLYYKKAKFKKFVTSVKPEYDYILEKYGYPKDAILLTGLPRWDYLKNTNKTWKQKTILIMPTWRNWLGGDRNKLSKTSSFEESAFYREWNSLLTDTHLINFAEKNNLKIFFYPHIGMRNFLDRFESQTYNIEIVGPDKNIQEYLSGCDLMVTDYSSVAFDFAYLKKPIIYFQFDEKDYRKKQLQEGYFNYRNDGFGDVFVDRKEVISEIEDYIKHDFGLKPKYEKRILNMFSGCNVGNCKRLYEVLNEK